MNWAYVAGFTDGEGYIGWARGKCRPVDSVASCNNGSPRILLGQSGERGLMLLEAIKSFLEENGIHSTVGKHKAPKRYNLQPYRLQISGRQDAHRFLASTLPFLFMKRTPAQDILRFMKVYPILSAGRSGATRLSWMTRRERYGAKGYRAVC